MRATRLRLLAAGAGLAALTGTTLAGTVSATAGGFSPAITVGSVAPAVPGLSPLLVQGATDAGAASGPVSLRLVLPFRNQAALDALVAGHGAPLTVDQFNAQFAPDPSTVSAVEAWASGAGLHVDGVTSNRLLVSVSGTAGAVGSAFGVTLHQLLSGGLSYISPLTTASLPAALVGQVSGVLGLSTLGRVGHFLSASTGPPISGLGPPDFWSFYDAPSGQTGQGQTMGILAEGDLTQVLTDLTQFENQWGLPHVAVTVKKVDGGSSDTSGSTEFDLDTQYSTGFAPGVSSLVVYDGASLADTQIADEINTFATDASVPQASFSAGECEVLAQVSGLVAAADASLQQAAAEGKTLFASSGDTGGFCPAVVGVNGVPAGVPNVNYPASSPFVMGVGGTTIANLPLIHEIAWYAGGGGVSLLEAQPTWQAGVGGSNLPVRRGVPDVALDADPNTGYLVNVAGTQTQVGGTSASSPSWLGIWTRAQGAHGGSLGFAGPVLYHEPASSFNDIIVGDNVPFPATPGWDYDTGRGTADITAIVNNA